MTTTKDGLLNTALALFAERGFAAVTVGDIEEAAGFARRGGTLYKHFESKDALLAAAMQRHVDSLTDFDGLLELLPLPDLASELRLLARWMLGRLDNEESISRVIEKESHRFPHLVDAMRTGLSDAGYRLASAYLTTKGFPAADSDATAVLLLGSLINLRRSRWTFGSAPLGIDDDVAVDAWVELCMSVLHDRRMKRPGPKVGGRGLEPPTSSV